MLKKLIKYDLKYLFNKLYPLYIGIFILFIFTNFIRYLDEVMMIVETGENFVTYTSHPIINYIYIIIEFVLLLGILFVIFNTLVVIVGRFNTNIYKNEGYLTNTLPINKKDLILSKFITGSIFIAISILNIFLLLGILFGQNLTILDNFKVTSSKLNLPIALLVVELFVLIVANLIEYMNLFTSAIAIGRSSLKTRKLLPLILIIVAMFAVSQIIKAVSFVLVLSLKPESTNFLNKLIPTGNSLTAVVITSLIISAIISFVYNLVSTKALYKLNLE